ncbi:MAG TPA: class I SAM-dependent methyltransferase [Pyrinomonadaceae bacterium]
MSQTQVDETLREWRASAPFWEKHAPIIRTMFAPLTGALIEETGIRQGQRVLDVAGGPGEPSLTIAETVGPTGSVTCTDVVAEMVKAAESEARRRGLTNIKFRQCAADALPFDDDSFDAAVSRLGVMFFPDPVAGLREMLRVTKPGGALSLAVWHKSDLNPFAAVVTNVISRYVETPPAAPGAPDAFRFAEPGSLAHVLEKAGATDVRERVLKFHIEAPISPEEFWAMRSETSGTLREKLTELSEEERARVAQEVQQSAREFFPHNRMSFPAQMLIVTGKKPS